METTYKHRQIGTVTLLSLGAGALVVIGSMIFGGHHPIALVVLLILLVTLVLFYCLTIEIGNGVLKWSFGPGIIRKSVPLKDIRSATAVRNHWIYGWGIRYTPSGWLYNVSGLDAVEIELQNGKRFRLGTDEPEQLVRAIEHAIANAKENT
jgi:hypothetical protein